MWGLLTDSGWEGAGPVGSPEAPVATSGPQQVLSVLGRHTLGVRWPREGEILLWIFPAFSKVCLGAVCAGWRRGQPRCVYYAPYYVHYTNPADAHRTIMP